MQPRDRKGTLCGRNPPPCGVCGWEMDVGLGFGCGVWNYGCGIGMGIMVWDWKVGYRIGGVGLGLG